MHFRSIKIKLYQNMNSGIRMNRSLLLIIVLLHRTTLLHGEDTINPTTDTQLNAGSNTDDGSGGLISLDINEPTTSGTTDEPTTTTTLKPRTSFKDADTWGKDYPSCDRSKNKRLSPINIDTKKAIKVKNVKTMMVFSGDPIRNYTLSTSYRGEGGVKISMLNIRVSKGIFYEATHIAGFGSKDFRLFRSMLFFFSKSPVHPSRSLHRMNGKVYPMEIVLFFFNQRLNSITAQVSVMVEIQDEDNPVFYPVTQAAKKIMQMKSKSAQIKELKKKLGGQNTELRNLMTDPRDPRLQKFHGRVAELTKTEKKLRRDKELLKIFEDTKTELAGLRVSTDSGPIMLNWLAIYQNIDSTRLEPIKCQLRVIKNFQPKGLPANATDRAKFRAVEERMTNICISCIPNCANVAKGKGKKKKKKEGEGKPGDPGGAPGKGRKKKIQDGGGSGSDAGGEETQQRRRGGKRKKLNQTDAGGGGTATATIGPEPGDGNPNPDASVPGKRRGKKRKGGGQEEVSDGSGSSDVTLTPTPGPISEGGSMGPGRRRNGTRKRKGGGGQGETEPSVSGRSKREVFEDTITRDSRNGSIGHRRVKRSFASEKIASLLQQKAEAESEMRGLVNLINREKRKMSPLLKEIGVNGINIELVQKDIAEGKKKMDEFQIGPEHEIKNMSMLKKLLRLEVALDIETRVAENHMNKTTTETKKAEEALGWSSPLFLFQGSWVLPGFGGYYYYNGSSPIPPCKQRLDTVVMNKSIGISQEQFDILASIPTYEGAEPLDEMVPPIQDMGGRKVYFNPKNLQYLKDDGVHLRSADRRKLKDKIRGAGNSLNSELSKGLLIFIAFVSHFMNNSLTN